jgi:hypothetical protein
MIQKLLRIFYGRSPLNFYAKPQREVSNLCGFAFYINSLNLPVLGIFSKKRGTSRRVERISHVF